MLRKLLRLPILHALCLGLYAYRNIPRTLFLIVISSPSRRKPAFQLRVRYRGLPPTSSLGFLSRRPLHPNHGSWLAWRRPTSGFQRLNSAIVASYCWPTAVASTSAVQAALANLLLPPGVVPVQRHSEGSKTNFAGLEGSNRRSPLQDEVDGGLTLTFPCFSSLLFSSYSRFLGHL